MRAAEDGWEELSWPPEAHADRGEWRRRLVQWRQDARRATAYDDALYRAPELAWVRSCFVSGMVMLWDQDVYDVEAGEFTIGEFLEGAERKFGGLDLVVLWHAYPRIGFDDRNQFDFFRQLPSGPDALGRLVAGCHERGVRVLLPYYPWDGGSRREPDGDIAALVNLVVASGADGVFLDTLAEGSAALQQQLSALAPGATLMTEGIVPLDRLGHHAASWAQWPPETANPYVLRDKWFEPRHMHHLVRRWHRDHTGELQLAWLNGVGVVVWENVFGSWVPWSAANQRLLRQMRPVHRHLGDIFSEGTWEPLVETSAAGVHASSWELGGLRLWTVANATDREVQGPLVPVETRVGESYWDLFSGAPARLGRLVDGVALAGDIGPGGAAAFAAAASPSARRRLAELIERSPAGREATAPPPRSTAAPSSRSGASGTSLAGPAGSSGPPSGMVAFGGGRHQLPRLYRLRECGLDGPAPIANVAYPDLHQTVEEVRDVVLDPFALGPAPVTNGEFHRFLAATGYRPRDGDNFLHHWPGNAGPGPAPAQLAAPVTFVDLGDARAYLEWAGARLPTPEEWQHGLESGRVGFGPVRVWEWTDSLVTDGHTRWCLLKGGAGYQAPGSDWYADGGPRPPSWTAKFIRWSPGLDRCATVGFRAALSV